MARRQPAPVAPGVTPAAGSNAVFTQGAPRGGETIGAAFRQTAQVLDTAGDRANLRALAFQALDDEANAKTAATTFDKFGNDLAFNPEKGYFAKLGKDAVDAYGDALSAAEKERDKLLDGMTPGARRMAEPVLAARVNALSESMSRHAQQQRRVWQVGVSEARAQALMADAANYYNDDRRFRQTVATLDQEALAQGELQGWGKEKVNAEQRKYRSEAWVQRIARMAIDQPVAALDLYRKNIDQVDGAQHAALEKLLKEQAYPVQSRELADRVMRGMPSPNDGLVSAVIDAESKGVQSAVSGKGAVGIMQLMPDTARAMAQKLGLDFDPEKLAKDANYNRQLGEAYLREMMLRYGGNQTVALAAYNAGPGNVDKWLAQHGNPNAGALSDEQWLERVPFKETREYVAKVNAAAPPKAGTPPTSADVRQHYAAWIESGRAAAKEIRPGDPVFADQVVSHINTYAAQIQQGAAFKEKTARDATMALALGLVRNPDGGFAQAPIQNRPQSLADLLKTPEAKASWATMDTVQQSAILTLLEHNARGQDRPLTPAAWEKFYELQGMARRDPQAFSQVNLADKALLDVLPNALVKDLMNEQAAVQTRERTLMEGGERLAHALGVAKPMLLAAGIKIPTEKSTETAKKTYDQFVGRLDAELRRYMEEKKTRPSDADIRGMVNGLLTEGSQAGTNWLWGLIGDGSKRAFEVPPAEFYVPVPKAERAKIAADYKSVYGREPTEAQMQEIYTAHQLKLRSQVPGAKP